MKKHVFYKFFAIIIIVAAADRLLGVFMQFELNHLKRGRLYQLNYKMFNANPDVAIIGSSRAYRHYNTAIIQQRYPGKVIDYGMDGTNVFCYYIILKTLLQTGKKPRLVMLDLKPNDFYIDQDTKMLSDFYPILDKMHFSDDDLAMVSPFEKIKLLSNGYRYNNHLLKIIRGTHGAKEDTAQITGYNPLPIKVAMLPQNDYIYKDFDKRAQGYFTAIIALCKRNNIQLVVCASPFYGNIVSSLTLDRAGEICRQNNVQYISYINNRLLGFDANLFSDEWHLNSAGADVFTRDFINRITTK